MEDIIAIAFACVATIFIGLGAIFVMGDYRYFPTITEQCQQQGYIQDNHTRIICNVEEK